MPDAGNRFRTSRSVQMLSNAVANMHGKSDGQPEHLKMNSVFSGALMVAVFLSGALHRTTGTRSFTLGPRCFLKDGEPFGYVSGTMHYWRVPHQYWEDTFIKMRYAGLTVVDTYLIWNLHEQEPGQFQFADDLNITRYFQLAQKHDLLVILRAGPFIAAEVEMGGLPYWLAREKPDIILRSIDPTYLAFVDRWYDVVLPLVKPYLYANGGPVITVQVENEYGAYGCDHTYMEALRDMYWKHLGNDVVLFTNNFPESHYPDCGKCEGTLITGDFGPTSISGPNVSFHLDNLAKWNPNGPLVDSEYYDGWLNSWGTALTVVSKEEVLDGARILLDRDASLNFYIFRGGTNFGFVAGAGEGPYQPITTSYEFNAALTESGDPTEKYFAIRKFVGEYFPLPPGPPPVPSPKGSYGFVKLDFVSTVFGNLQRLSPKGPVFSLLPLSFEMLNQAHGFVLYRSTIRGRFKDPSKLEIPGLRDRAYVYLDQMPLGVLGRGIEIFSMGVTVRPGQTLNLLVQNEGRAGFFYGTDPKGIIGNVSLDGQNLTRWEMYPLKLPHFPVRNPSALSFPPRTASRDFEKTAAFYSGKLNIDKALDTFLDMTGWRTGYAFVNGHNLGRYWPVQGPQITLYVPGVFLNQGRENVIEIFELEEAPCRETSGCFVRFTDIPILNGTVPGAARGSELESTSVKVPQKQRWRLS